jgi:hypothetical protein
MVSYGAVVICRGEALRKQHELIMELEALLAEANAHKEEAQNNELFLANQLEAQGKEYEVAIKVDVLKSRHPRTARPHLVRCHHVCGMRFSLAML